VNDILINNLNFPVILLYDINIIYVFQADVAPSCGDVNNYMASVQSLSALTDDNHTVTSLPLSARPPTQFQYVPPTAGFYNVQGRSQSTIHGQYVESGQTHSYGPSAHWQHGRLAQPYWNVSGFAGPIADGHNWSKYQPHHHAQHYVNGLGPHTEPSAWHRGWPVRYHPYATAGAGTATTAGSRANSVGVARSSSSTACRYVCNGVDQQAPAYVAQSYTDSLGGANNNSIRQTVYDSGDATYVAYPTPQTDYGAAACNSYQLSSPYNHLNDL